jgi:SAM-dependent methyltransferase
MSAALDLYGAALRHGRGSLSIRLANGDRKQAKLHRWLAASDSVDERALSRVTGPVLDVGSGPGRHLAALSRRGVDALGIDPCPEAVQIARRTGARVVTASIFERVPLAGHWRFALLLDGNIGIGGRPKLLLTRLRTLLARRGQALVELERPGTGVCTELVQLEYGETTSEPFEWSRVGADAIGRLAIASGFLLCERWQDEGRWFARLERTR